MIIDTDDFLDQFSFRQPEADHLCRLMKVRDKKEVFKLFKDKGIETEDFEKYYNLILKDFDSSFEIIADNSFLEDDRRFLALSKEKFLFSVGLFPVKGLMWDGKIYHDGTYYSRQQVRQIWIVRELP